MFEVTKNSIIVGGKEINQYSRIKLEDMDFYIVGSLKKFFIGYNLYFEIDKSQKNFLPFNLPNSRVKVSWDTEVDKLPDQGSQCMNLDIKPDKDHDHFSIDDSGMVYFHLMGKLRLKIKYMHSMEIFEEWPSFDYVMSMKTGKFQVSKIELYSQSDRELRTMRRINKLSEFIRNIEKSGFKFDRNEGKKVLAMVGLMDYPIGNKTEGKQNAKKKKSVSEEVSKESGDFIREGVGSDNPDSVKSEHNNSED